MRAYGADRFRMSGERVILHSPLVKGWTPRRARETTHAEFPGTTVLWDEEYYEVIAADALPNGGIRYVLERWNEAHTIRVFEPYDDESEARLLADLRATQKQRATRVVAQLTGIFLGHLPYHAQQRIANNLGVSPFAMTMLSTIPSIVLLGVCAYLFADSLIDKTVSPVPIWLWLVALFLFAESLLRSFVALSQNRGIGSLLGAIVYVMLNPREALEGSRDTFDPKVMVRTPEVELSDRLTMRGPLLTLLSVEEQRDLAQRYGFDYREHAYVITWILLVGALLGAISSLSTLVYSPFRLSALISLVVASVLLIEQIVRLQTLKSGPAPSILAFAARPFARALLEKS
ncbi:MAG TPA: hypothetical protein VHW00_24015 [Thermoanaerobaculia bacterium]|nr:hypothetical protein [Thermoanaerobaculia bacterium]